MGKYVKPKEIVLMHIEPNNLQKYKNIVKEIDATNAYIFDKSLESKFYRFTFGEL